MTEKLRLKAFVSDFTPGMDKMLSINPKVTLELINLDEQGLTVDEVNTLLLRATAKAAAVITIEVPEG